MDYNNKKHIIVYLIVGGFIFYILSVMLSSIFIIPVPQDQDWCLESMKIQVSGPGRFPNLPANDYKNECVKFKNDFEMLKSDHNYRRFYCAYCFCLDALSKLYRKNLRYSELRPNVLSFLIFNRTNLINSNFTLTN